MQNETPVGKVIEMRKQGMSNNQISQTLQREGYNSTQIYDALNQADTKGGVEPIPQETLGGPQPENSTGSGQPLNLGMSQEPQSNQFYQDDNSYNQPQQQDYYSPSNIGTEELVESIIDEKWEDLMKDINKVIEWKNRTETRVTQMEQKMEDLKDSFDKLHKAVIGKIGDYDKHILDVGTEVKALEKVFQKVLPQFADNVKELSIISERFKKSNKTKKKK
jgi:prefoldin subunit 5